MDGLKMVAAEKIIHLTTTGRKTGKPRVVELWFALSNGKVYLSHEGKETDWMKNIKENAQVSIEVDGSNSTGKARYLQEDTNESMAAKTALYEKYYGKAERKVIEDWFSLSSILTIDLTST